MCFVKCSKSDFLAGTWDLPCPANVHHGHTSCCLPPRAQDSLAAVQTRPELGSEIRQTFPQEAQKHPQMPPTSQIPNFSWGSLGVTLWPFHGNSRGCF